MAFIFATLCTTIQIKGKENYNLHKSKYDNLTFYMNTIYNLTKQKCLFVSSELCSSSLSRLAIFNRVTGVKMCNQVHKNLELFEKLIPNPAVA